MGDPVAGLDGLMNFFFRLVKGLAMTTVAVPDSVTDVPEIRAGMLDLAERFAALCDEAMALVASTNDRLAPGGGDDVVHGLVRLDPEYGVHMARLWHGALQDRRSTAKDLVELFDAIERTRR